MLLDQQKKIKGLQSQIDSLYESLRLERYRKYAASSEKVPEQQELFNEADQLEPETEVAEVTHTAGTQVRRKRKPESCYRTPSASEKYSRTCPLRTSVFMWL